MFNAAGFVLLYAILRLQGYAAAQSAGLRRHEPAPGLQHGGLVRHQHQLAGYGGETTLSYFSQMVGLTVQNFVSAATGMAVVVPLARAFGRAKATTVGNFWVDLTRVDALRAAAAVDRRRVRADRVRRAAEPAANTSMRRRSKAPSRRSRRAPSPARSPSSNSAPTAAASSTSTPSHPYENPNIWSNVIELWAILALSLGLAVSFGRMIGREREGWALLGVMMLFMVAGCAIAYWAEAGGNPLMHAMGVDGGNMEGKEVRFGIPQSVTWATFTTGASNGSVNSMHNSYMPLGGLVPLLLIQTRRGRCPAASAPASTASSSSPSSPCSLPASWWGARRNTSARSLRPRK